ncbi:hypothetical protein [Pseudomonas hormoni]|uniref:hypothetical protein n=1 Tax=Pseudomonas hormoni TaxID=3093767 RepID=UPI00202804B3|nr:hypothetical protein [Pseudomonas hormoni]
MHEVGEIGAAGILGAYPMYYSSFIAMLVGPVLHIAFSVATKGRYYFKNFPQDMATQWQPAVDYRGPRPAVEAL